MHTGYNPFALLLAEFQSFRIKRFFVYTNTLKGFAASFAIHQKGSRNSFPYFFGRNLTLYVFLFVGLEGGLKSQSLAMELHAGVLNYQGDLRQEAFTLKDGRASIGLGLTADITKRLGIRFLYLRGTIHADDKANTEAKYYFRNLSFWSRISEQGLQLQFQFFDGENAKINPFIVAGISTFHFDPYTYDKDSVKHRLQPLSTEGQGVIAGAPEPYRLQERSYPIGGGIRFTINEKWSLSWEITFRYTKTDYLDDVSTRYPDPGLLTAAKGPKSAELSFRAMELPGVNPLFPNGFNPNIVRGNPANGDWYYFSGIKMRYNLFPISIQKRGERRANRAKGSTDCPRW